MGGAIIVFAKRPQAGRVKTRLCPPFTPAEAAAFYAAMLADVLHSTATIARALKLAPVLAVAPPSAAASFAAPPEFKVVAQRGAGLARRMAHALAAAFAAGHAPVLLRGSDSPVMAQTHVRAALAALARGADAAFAPDGGGGYSLAAFARPAPGVFNHPMGDAKVLAATRARAEARGLACALLPPAFDVDTAADVARLHSLRLNSPRAGNDAAANCPRTLAYLAAHPGITNRPRANS